MDLDNLTAHPFADMFPRLSDQEVAELAESIARDGLLEKIVLYGGQILDGRNRYAALKLLGATLVFEDHFTEFDGTEEQAGNFVQSANINRRHLTASQRAMLAADFANLRKGEVTKPRGRHNVAPDRPAGITQREARERFSVSERMIQLAKQVKRSAQPHIADMVTSGALPVEVAAKIAEMPAAAQRKLKTSEQAAAKAKELRIAGDLGVSSSYVRHTMARLAADVVTMTNEIASRELEDLKPYRLELEGALQRLAEVCDAIGKAPDVQESAA